MKKIYPLGLAALILALLMPAVAAQAPATVQTLSQSGLKIAFLNFAQVLEGTEEAKAEINKVRGFMDQKQKDYDSAAAELQQLQQTYQQQERALNATTRADMQRQIQDKTKGLQRFQEDTQTEINGVRDELFGRLSQKIQVILGEYGQQNAYAAILFLDQLQGYFNPSLDITQEIIRIYNDRHPVAATTP